MATDKERLDWLESQARCNPLMGVQLYYFPTSKRWKLNCPFRTVYEESNNGLRQIIDKAMLEPTTRTG
jgi:hypothetical protein